MILSDLLATPCVLAPSHRAMLSIELAGGRCQSDDRLNVKHISVKYLKKLNRKSEVHYATLSEPIGYYYTKINVEFNSIIRFHKVFEEQPITKLETWGDLSFIELLNLDMLRKLDKIIIRTNNSNDLTKFKFFKNVQILFKERK